MALTHHIFLLYALWCTAKYISWVIWHKQGVLFSMVVFKNGLKLISWIELLSTLWFFLNLSYLVWNFCVRIMKEMRNSSWTNLCFLSAKFFYRLQDNKVIIKEITLWQQLVFRKFMKNSKDKSMSTTTTLHLHFWKGFWIPPIVNP